MNDSNHRCSVCGACMLEATVSGRCANCLLGLGADPALFLAEPPRPGNGSRYFGDYKLLEEIARGGMGVVFKAQQLSLNRIVALKMILAGHFASPEAVQRFRSEAEVGANLQHPNIVAIHEVGEHEGQPYFSMEYIEGSNLAALARNGPLPATQAARYLQALSEAIQHAHEQDILHRDLKPSNVLIDPRGQPRITDFGLAKRLNSSSDLTVTGQTLGSPGYMSPEQAAGKRGKIGPHSDIYSLGGVLYCLLTGRAPFAAETVQMTLDQVANQQPVAPRILNPGVPRDLETICLKCLEKDPARRYPSARELAEELGRFLRNEPIHARRSGLVQRSVRWSRRHPMGAVLFLSLALGLAGALILLRMVNDEKNKQIQIRGELEREQIIAGRLLSMTVATIEDKLEDLWLNSERLFLQISSEELSALSGQPPADIAPQGEIVRYRFGLSANASAVADARRYAPLLARIEEGMSRRRGHPVRLDLKIYKLKQDRSEALVRGEVDFSRLAPYGYLRIKTEHPNIQGLAKYDTISRPATFFTRPETRIQTLADLKGRRLAFGDIFAGLTLRAQVKLLDAGILGRDLAHYDFLDSRLEFVEEIRERDLDATLERRGAWLHGTGDVIDGVIAGEYDAGVTTLLAFEKNKHRGIVRIPGSEFETTPGTFVARGDLPPDVARDFVEVLTAIRNEPFLLLLPDRPTGFEAITPETHAGEREGLRRIEGMFPPRTTPQPPSQAARGSGLDGESTP